MSRCCNLARIPAIPQLSKVSIRPKCSKSSQTFSSSSSSPSYSTILYPLQVTLSRPIPLSSTRFLHKTFRNDSVLRPRISSFGFHLKKPRYFSTGFLQRTLEKSSNAVKPRNFSSGSPQKVLENSGRGPWIAACRDREGKKRASAQTSSSTSSWEQSAESYFSRNGRNSLNEKRESIDGSTVNIQENRRNVDCDKEDKGNGEGRRIAVRANRTSWEESAGNIFSRNGSNRKSRNVNVEVVEEEEDPEPIDDLRRNRIRSNYKRFIDRESQFEKPEHRKWNKQENWGRKTWKEASESSVPKIVGQGVYGVGPVLAALTVGRREFYALYVQEGLNLNGKNRKKKDKKGVEKVLKLAEKIGLKVIEASKHDLNMVVDNRPHQGLVLDASPLEMVYIRELEPVSMEDKNAPLWVALDEVTDPQNLGAIVRSAYFFGVEGVVLCAKNSAPLSGVVSKASAGSLELIELRSCKNMMQFLSSSIENGWRVLGGSVSSKALPLSDIEARMPTIIVLGSEGSGLRPVVERSCTQLIRIPGNAAMDGFAGGNEFEVEEAELSGGTGQELKSFLAVESLNVSVAAGVLLYHLARINSIIVAAKSNTVLE